MRKILMNSQVEGGGGVKQKQESVNNLFHHPDLRIWMWNNSHFLHLELIYIMKLNNDRISNNYCIPAMEFLKALHAGALVPAQREPLCKIQASTFLLKTMRVV